MSVIHLQFYLHGQLLYSKSQVFNAEAPPELKEERNHQTLYFQKKDRIDQPLTFGTYLVALIAFPIFRALALFDVKWRPWAFSYWQQIKTQIKLIQCYEQIPAEINL